MTTLRLPDVLCGAVCADVVRETLRSMPDGVRVVLDLRTVTELDNAVLGALAGGARDLRARGGRVEVSELSPPVRRVLAATGLMRMLRPPR